MAKYLTNNSARVICLGTKNLIPGGEPVEVTDKEIAHPIIAAKIKAGILTLTEDSKPAAAADDQLSEMTIKELQAYADANGIDLGDATKKADILAAINAAEAEESGE